tara:strand:- start:416 stop:565 length:150 start_codon:yes stop_codon:yes gene_type:complete
MEPEFSSLGLQPTDVLGVTTEEELEVALKLLTIEVHQKQFSLLIKKTTD